MNMTLTNQHIDPPGDIKGLTGWEEGLVPANVVHYFSTTERGQVPLPNLLFGHFVCTNAG